MKLKPLYIALVAVSLLLVSCKTYQVDSNAKRLSIGMTKEQVTALLGGGYESVHASVTQEGNVVETWDYPTLTDIEAVYKLYFVDGKLLRWDKEWLAPPPQDVFIQGMGDIIP